MSTAESGLMCSRGACISVREDVMRKPTDDFFFLFLSVREKLVCMSQNDQRERER